MNAKTERQIENLKKQTIGVALGVDRLVMLALGAETLAEVIAFSVDRA